MLTNQRPQSLDIVVLDGMTRHTEEALQWGEDVAERGLKEVVADRDRPWQDYGQRPS